MDIALMFRNVVYLIAVCLHGTNGLTPNINFCRATMSGFGNDGLYYDPNTENVGTTVDFSILSPNYPYYYQNESCICTLTTTEDQDRFTIVSKFMSYRENTKGCPSMLYIEFNDEGYSACDDAHEPNGYTTYVNLRSGDAIKFYLANQHQHDVKASVNISGMVGEYTFLKCVRESVELSSQACSCKPKPPEYYISHTTESNNLRVALAFTGLIIFLLLFGAAVLIWWCIRRRRRRNKPEDMKKIAENKSQESINSSIARNSAFFTDPELPKNAHGIYAEIDFGAGLPFSPDPNMRLEMRRSVDSGLYSEMGDRQGTSGSSGLTPRTASYEVLGFVGEKHEPPASQSSPNVTQHQMTSQELEQLYSKPSKRSKKKNKSKTKALERQDSEEVYQHPPLPARNWTNPPVSHLQQPNFNPDPPRGYVGPMGSKTGSMSSGLFTGHADLGQGVLQSSRSSLNEMYVTDSRSTINLQLMNGNMETDI